MAAPTLLGAGPGCGCNCEDVCTIQSDTFDGDLSAFAQVGTVSIGAGVATLETGEGLVTTGEPTNYYDPVIFSITAETADASGTLRLAVARLDADNYLFGEYSFSGSSGTLRLGQRVATVESWLTDAVTVEDTADLGDLTEYVLCWVPGELQEGGDFEVIGYPLAFTDDNTWTDPGNATWEDDNAYAVSSITTGTFGEAWSIFGLIIPPGSVINGIVVNVIGYGTENSGMFTPTIDSVTLKRPDGTVVGDDKGGGESLPNVHGTVTYGGAADDWNAGLTWEDISSPGFAVLIDFTTDSNDVYIDTVQVKVFFTTPDRRPGRLTFSRANVTAATVDCEREYNVDAPGVGKKAMVLSGAGEWDVASLDYKYHQSESKPTCPTCAEENGGCPGSDGSENCAPCCPSVSAEYVIDFGVGGWSHGSFCEAECEFFAGEIVVGWDDLIFLEPCEWIYQIQGSETCAGDPDVYVYRLIHLSLIYDDVAEECYWRVFVWFIRVVPTFLGSAWFGSTAEWESDRFVAEAECVMPIELTKTRESSTLCTGSLPETIWIEDV